MRAYGDPSLDLSRVKGTEIDDSLDIEGASNSLSPHDTGDFPLVLPPERMLPTP